jgi:hypothetical protein
MSKSIARGKGKGCIRQSDATVLAQRVSYPFESGDGKVTSSGISSGISIRDAKAPSSLLSYPPKLDLRPFLKPVKDQGRVEACVAFSLTTLMEYQDAGCPTLSPLYLYHRRPTEATEGMEVDQGIAILIEHGVVDHASYRLALWPRADRIGNYAVADGAVARKVDGFFELFERRYADRRALHDHRGVHRRQPVHRP